MNTELSKCLEATADAWEELTSNQTSRTGASAGRVASALANDVDAEVLALQVSKNSEKNNPEAPITFTAADMVSVAMWYAANKTRSALPKRQTGGLIRGQQIDDGKMPTPSPA